MNFLNQLKIGVRLGAAFALLLLMLAGVAGFGTWKIHVTDTHVGTFSDNIVPSLRAVQAMRGQLGDLRQLESQFLLLNSEKDFTEFEGRIAKMQSAVSASLKDYEKLIADDTDRANLQAAQVAVAAYQGGWNGLRTLARQSIGELGKHEEAKKLLFGDTRAAYAKASSAIDAVWTYNEKLGDAAARAASQGYDNALRWMAGVTAVAVLFGLIGALWISRSITQPMHQAIAIAQRIGAGDLSAQIQPRGRDETAQMLSALQQMNQSLVTIVGQVRNCSDSIATGSAQIATGNADLSQRTEEQASNLEQTAASMEQLTATVKNNADTARQAAQLADGASAVAAQGGAMVGQVVATMGEISASSKRIADIIGTIDGIAFQTNILALNAAVEAARAGEQGRGFAVVAAEVRTLAQRSAQAAREIKQLITESVEKVETGTRLVDSAGATMGNIVSQVKSVADLIGEITNASQEQSQGIGQVGAAVAQLDQVTQQNAALVEESAAAAESLNQQAAQLAQTVARFQM